MNKNRFIYLIIIYNDKYKKIYFINLYNFHFFLKEKKMNIIYIYTI